MFLRPISNPCCARSRRKRCRIRGQRVGRLEFPDEVCNLLQFFRDLLECDLRRWNRAPARAGNEPVQTDA
jgi:hypothetical protein